MKRIMILCVLALFLPGGTLEAMEPDWEFLKETDGIRVYRRDVPGMDFDAFQGKAIVHARIEVIGMVLRDVLAYPEWMPNCKETQLIETFDKQNVIIHQVNKTPWPLKNRDSVVKANTTITWRNGVFTVDLQAIDDPRVPPHPNRIRITKMSGRWQLTYLHRDQTFVSYMICLDPGGSLPKYIVKKNMQDAPVNMLRSLRKVVKNPIYLETADQSEDRKMIEEYIKRGLLTE